MRFVNGGGGGGCPAGACAATPIAISPVNANAVSENDNRGSLRKAGQIFLQPAQLFGADFRLGARDVVERYEMDAAVIERVERLAKDFTI